MREPWSPTHLAISILVKVPIPGHPKCDWILEETGKGHRSADQKLNGGPPTATTAGRAEWEPRGRRGEHCVSCVHLGFWSGPEPVVKSGHLSHVYLNFKGPSWPKVTSESVTIFKITDVALDIRVLPANRLCDGATRAGGWPTVLEGEQRRASELREEGQLRERGPGLPV